LIMNDRLHFLFFDDGQLIPDRHMQRIAQR
jgi:hypothetical protein